MAASKKSVKKISKTSIGKGFKDNIGRLAETIFKGKQNEDETIRWISENNGNVHKNTVIENLNLYTFRSRCFFLFILISIFTSVLVYITFNIEYKGIIDDNSIFLFTTVVILLIITLILLYQYDKTSKINSFIDIDMKKTSNKKIDKLVDNLEFRLLSINNFQNYFNIIIVFIERQIDSCDKKASLLLQRGTLYAIFGTFFYLFIVLLWQYIIYKTGFKTQYIYGIIACSLLFIFIEFFSAWFLKQYRQYVDTSTYLVKIKSILERYFLAYLAIKDSKDNGVDYSQLINMLSAEIKWPETYLLKKQDIGFAKECLETATNLLKSLREETKKNIS